MFFYRGNLQIYFISQPFTNTARPFVRHGFPHRLRPWAARTGPCVRYAAARLPRGNRGKLPRMHTCVNRHMRAMRVRASRACSRERVLARAHAHMRTCAPAFPRYKNVVTRPRVRARAHAPAPSCTRAPAAPHMRVRVHAHRRAGIRTRARMREYKHQRIPTHVRTRARAHADACASVPDVKERACAFARARVSACPI